MTSKRSKTKTRRVWAGAVVASAFGVWSVGESLGWRGENVPTVDFANSGKTVETGEVDATVKIGRACEPLNPTAPGRLPRTLDGLRLAPDFGCFWGFSVDGDDYR
ncbi:MAG: hypothetical protein IIW01_01735, partial [Thermoguttaceae bacterium]|nr:hypothetical protein [Thermoguttaceae bacterium]